MEPLGLALEAMEMRQYAWAKTMVEEPDTDTETLLKRGLSQRAIDLVMDNTARSLAEGRET